MCSTNKKTIKIVFLFVGVINVKTDIIKIYEPV